MAEVKNEPIETHGAASSSPSYLEWSPVWAGALVSVAITVILLQFGAAVGLALGEPVRADQSVSYNFIVAALWLLLVSVAASSAAGYIAGRMRMTMNDAVANEVEFRDGIHGVTAWALASVFVGVMSAVTTGLGALAIAGAKASVPELSAEMQIVAGNQATIVAFATAAGAVLGAAAAWAASIAGGKHRDEGTSINVVVPGMFRK